MSTQNQNTSILMLICTALLMLAVLTVLDSNNDSTLDFAGSMQDRGGDYSITVARLSEGQETVWVLDSRHRTIGICFCVSRHHGSTRRASSGRAGAWTVTRRRWERSSGV